jgi:hypothetical protein
MLYFRDAAYNTCVAGIAASTRSLVKQFTTNASYDDYYDIVVDIGEINVEQFAMRVQTHCKLGFW